MSYESDPCWHAILWSEAEDAAFRELERRRDREFDHTPAHANARADAVAHEEEGVA